MMANVLSAKDVHKNFREGQQTVSVLKGCSLSVARGEIVALEGPSGSGKTTFLSVLGCILTPTAGEVWIDGTQVDSQSPRTLPHIRKRSIGFVFQQFNLFPALNVSENIEFALNIKGVRGASAQKEAQRVIAAVGLEDRKNFLPRDLSGGQKQRVAIARALAGGPTVLLADEPTANLDAQTGEQILALFRDLAKREQRGLVIVTHDHRVRAVVDRVVKISDGRLLTDA